jgi:hypothetical protein
MAYVSRSQQWGPFPKTAASDALRLTVTNLKTVTVDVARAGLTCSARLDVKTDGPLDVVLAGCGSTRHFG